MRATLSLLLLASGCATDPRAATAAVIFGADDRIELYETDAVRRELFARSVPAMVRASVVRTAADGTVTLANRPLGPSHDLCDGEAHFDQPSAASCSGTLVDDALVLTAGHCVESVSCAEQRWVFGWYYDEPGVIHRRTTDDVFSCAEIVAFSGGSGDDFALVELDRAPPGPPAEVRLDPVTLGEPTSLAGFPLGIPMKVVEMGPVTMLGRDEIFYARLDAHPGNSGSGVFDAELRVVGELTNGPVDAYEDVGDCRVLRVIGEDTTRTETIRSVAAAVDQLCTNGYPSARLCGAACGDGTCAAGEDCPADCASDAGALEPDAGGTEADAGAELADAGAADAGPAIDPRVPGGGGCSCRTGRGARTPLRLAALVLALAVRRRARDVPAQTADP